MSKDGIKLGRRSKKFKQNLKSTVGSVIDKQIDLNNTHINLSHSPNRKKVKLNGHQMNDSIDKTKTHSVEKLINNNSSSKPVVQENKIIIKAIDILTAAAATAQLAQPVLANNTHILNNSLVDNPPASVLTISQNSPMLFHNSSNEIFLLNTNTAKISVKNSNSLIINEESISSEQNNLLVQHPETVDRIKHDINNNHNNNDFTGPIILLNSLNTEYTLQSYQQVNWMLYYLKILKIYSKILFSLNIFFQTTTEHGTNKKLIPQKKLDKKSPEVSYRLTKSSNLFSIFNETQLNVLIQKIVQAYLDTFTAPLILRTPNKLSLNFKNNPDLSSKFECGLLKVLKETDFLDYFNNLIESAVLFAKNVPYFMSIHESDRITLLKACVFEIILVRHAVCYSSKPNQLHDIIKSNSLDTLAAVAAASTSDRQKSQIFKSLDIDETDSLLWIPGCEVWASCEWLCEKIPDLKQFLRLLIDFCQFFNAMNLNNNQIAVFCAYLLYDRGKALVLKQNISKTFYFSRT